MKKVGAQMAKMIEKGAKDGRAGGLTPAMVEDFMSEEGAKIIAKYAKKQ